MRLVSQILVYVVLVCLFLSLTNGTRRSLHRASSDDRMGGQPYRSRVRLRRYGGDNPAHHPVRPCKNALLPPDDDDCDRPRLNAKDTHDRSPSLSQDRASRCLSAQFHSRPLPTPLSRHQTLCILLI